MATPPILNQSATKKAARNAIDFYATIWKNDTTGIPKHVWQWSNQIDSYLNFAEQCTRAFGSTDYDWFNIVQDIDVAHNPSSLVANLWKNITNSLEVKDLWSDDYGWAGIACLQMANFVMNKPNANPVWQFWYKRAVQCWQRMKLVADTLSKGGDPIPDGILNRPLVLDMDDHYHDHYVKNTVTNALYYALSLRLYLFIRNTNDIPVDPDFRNIKHDTLQSAYAMYIWFRGWINTIPNGPTLPRSFWHDINGQPKVAMLEERPVAYPPHKGVDSPLPPDNTYDGYNPYDGPNDEIPTAPPYSQQAAWAGDQGLFLHGCCLLYIWQQDLQTELGLEPSIVAQVNADMLNWIPAIADGVLQALTQTFTDNVLRDCPFDSIMLGDPDDYVCGRGVLARYFMRTETLWALQLMEYDIVSVYAAAWQATSYYCASSNPNFKVANPSASNPGQLGPRWNSGPNTFNPINDQAANKKFCLWWGVNPDQHYLYVWPAINKYSTPAYLNYCVMNGFDVFGAWIQTNPSWTPQSSQETKKEERSNGKHENGERDKCEGLLSDCYIPKKGAKKQE